MRRLIRRWLKPSIALLFLLSYYQYWFKILIEAVPNQILAKRGCMAILKLDKHDEDKEIEFELDYLTSLTTSQRFEMMFRKTE